MGAPESRDCVDGPSTEVHAPHMLLQDGRYFCILCGAEIEITSAQRPVTLIKASSGEPTQRVIMLGDHELHACPFTPNAAAGAD